MPVADLDPIPLADGASETAVPARGAIDPTAHAAPRAQRRTRIGTGLAPLVAVLLCALHGLAIWWGLGGAAGLANGWPLWRDDHPLYYHSALVTRTFLQQSWTTAGYDPSFMGGYAKSVVYPASSTLPELVIAAFGGRRPELAYKLYVLVSAALVPWLVALACVLWRIPAVATALAVMLELLYIWTDFPINYAAFGMLPYFLSIPLALVAAGAFARFLTRPGFFNWLFAAGLMSLAFLVHLTTAMILVPAAALAYAAIIVRGSPKRTGQVVGPPTVPHGPAPTAPERRSRWLFHAAVWTIPLVVLVLNAFWWLPGVFLASTKGPSDFAFVHSREGVAQRLLKIFGEEAPIQGLLVAAGLPGLLLLLWRGDVPAWALVGFCLAGMFWGYLAGGAQSLDLLQPGRHTYAFFTALAVGGGAALDELRRRLRAGAMGADRLDLVFMIGAAVLAVSMLRIPVTESLRARLWTGEPFLSSRPSPRLLWVVDRVRRYVQPGERLLYEEGGKDLPAVPDPFHHGRFSGLLPERTGVEVIGGPYLHAALATNFTQFGEGKLCGKADWGRPEFLRCAKLYRPVAILCWSPRARRFCRQNADLVQILDEDGPVLIGRVLGVDGDALEGTAKIEAEAGRIHVSDMVPALDGSIVLRYHSVPYLTTTPRVVCEPVNQEDDPVPFIRLRPPPGTSDVEVKLQFPVGR
jgi:hypothetical protein